MGVKDSFLTIIFANLFGNLIVAYFSTFGPKTGLRQLTLTRFSFGYYTVMIPVLLNALACIGELFCYEGPNHKKGEEPQIVKHGCTKSLRIAGDFVHLLHEGCHSVVFVAPRDELSLTYRTITGWSTVNAIVGGQALRAVAIDSSLPKMPIEVAIVIIAVLTFIFSFMG